MDNEILNNLKAFLIGGDGAPSIAPNGLLALRNLSVEKLARAARITRTMVYLYIEGKSRPTEPVLARMCEVLQVPVGLGREYCTPATTGRPPRKQS